MPALCVPQVEVDQAHKTQEDRYVACRVQEHRYSLHRENTLEWEVGL